MRYNVEECGKDFIILDCMYVLFDHNKKNNKYFLHYEKGVDQPTFTASLTDEARKIFRTMMMEARFYAKVPFVVYDDNTKEYDYFGSDNDTATDIFDPMN